MESGVIRASHVYYMNDQNEIRYAIDKFIEIIRRHGNKEKDSPISTLLSQIPEWLQNIRNNPHYIFVFSLSEKGNLLSQWRAYTPHGTGISIGFNKNDLSRFAEKNGLLLLRCLYDREDQNSILSQALEKILSEFEIKKDNIDISNKPAGQEYHSYLQIYTGQLLKEFIKIKDPAFPEECEWRLVSKYYKKYTDNEIQFRSGKTTLVPYVNFELKKIRDDNKFFEQVYVGPSPNYNLAHNTIAAYLSNKNACRRTINSQQPYREV